MSTGYRDGTPLASPSPAEGRGAERGPLHGPARPGGRGLAGAYAREKQPTPAVGEGLADTPWSDGYVPGMEPQVSAPVGIWERIKASPLADNPLLLAVAGIGFSVSFQTISREAAAHGLPGWSPLYPVGVDVGILALILEARKLARLKRSDLVPRVLAWALAIGTIYVNMHGSPPHDWIGRTLHAIMPALWIVFLELTRWRQRADIKKVEKADPIPLARWLLDPWGTARLKRRMIMTRVHSYALASASEDARRFMRDLALAHYGGRWAYWRKAPSLLRSDIRKGRLGDAVTAAVTAKTGWDPDDWQEDPGGWEEAVVLAVTAKVTQGDKLAVAVRQERRQIATPERATTPRQSGARATRQSGGSKSDRNRARVASVKAANPGLTVKELADAAGMTLRTFQRYSTLSVVENAPEEATG